MVVLRRCVAGVYVVQPIVLQNNTALQIAVGTFVNATRNCPGKGFPTLMLPRPARCGGAESTASYPPCGTVLFAANVHNFSVRRDERQTGKEESAGGLSVCRQLRHTPHVRTNGVCVRRTNRTRRGHRWPFHCAARAMSLMELLVPGARRG